MIFFIILCVCVIGGFIAMIVIGKIIENKMYDSGEMLKREKDFYKKREIFITKNIKFTDIINSLSKQKEYLDKNHIKYEEDKNYELIRFNHPNYKYDWNAKLYCKKGDDENNVYVFEFTHWVSSNGVVVTVNLMNVCLTTVEKILLELDPDAKVSSEYIKTKTKTSFL